MRTLYAPARDSRAVRERYDQLKAALWQERSTFDPHWRELGSYLLPRRVRFQASDRNKGDQRNQKIIDSTARFSARTLQSGLHAGLTSPARPWMRLTTPDPDLADFAPVKAWLHVVTQRMLTVFLQTNLYNVLPMIYGDLGVFGTACMSVVEDAKDLFRCYPYPTGSYALGLNSRGLVSTFCRDYELTVRQVVETFGVTADRREIDWSAISTTVKDLWDKGTYEAAVPLVWLVKPNDDHRPDKLEAKFLPFSSCHYEAGETQGKLLRESGFHTFPIMAPRWDLTGEDTYGTDCPGMTALGDIKQLQLMQKEKAKAIQKMVSPPMVAPMSLFANKVTTLPDDTTYDDSRDNGVRALYQINFNVDHLRADIGETQYRIQRAFYEDLFLMLARSDGDRGGQPVTAREIDERHEEKLLALGPVLERTNDELLDPLVDRVYGLMERAGLIPDPPEQLEGVDLKVEYISIMAQAQKLVGVVGQDRLIQTVIGMAQIWPDAAAKVNTNQILDNYGDMLGVDPRVIRSNEDVEAIAQAAAEQAQLTQEAAPAKDASAAAKNLGSTPMTGETALSQLMGAAGTGDVGQAAA